VLFRSFEKTSDGLFVVEVTSDMRYRLVSYNPAQEKMVGVSAADAVGKLNDEYLPASVVAVVNEQNRLCIEAGTPMSFEAAIDLPAGRSYFHTTLVPVRDATGRIHRLVGLARDMTETRRILEALRSSEEKFSRAFHGSPDSITISALEDGVILEVNESFLSMYWYKREEVIGRTSLPGGLNLWVDPGDRERLLALVMEEGVALGEGIAFRRRDGSIRYCLITWSIIEIEGVKRVLSITRDMTERRKMEEALRDSEARFRLLAENSTDLISRHTPEGVYLYVSPSCTTLLGYSPAQLLGRSAYEFFHPEDLEAIRESHGTILEMDTAYTVSYRIRRADGSWTWFESASRAIRDPATGQVMEIHSSGRDISERHRAQEREREHELALFQASKMASLGTLVSGIAHEINNPNNFIRLNSQNLREFWGDIRTIMDAADAGGPLSLHGIPWETARGMVDDLLGGIGEGSSRIEKLLLNLRDFARGDEGRLNETVEMNAVVRSAVMIVRNLIQKSTDSFVVRETPGLPIVRGNYHQIEQVVINLVTNACQALPARDRGVTIETGMEDGGEWVVLRVIDEGIGIPPENLTRVIDPFFTTRRQAGGSGLGLSVSSRIVQNHGGTMSFTSTVDTGTVVTVRFPASGRAS
jgi:PAS domain S-box-containing protein